MTKTLFFGNTMNMNNSIAFPEHGLTHEAHLGLFKNV